MKKNKVKKLSLLFAAALTTCLMGNAAKAYAADIEMPSSTNEGISLYNQTSRDIQFNLKNGASTGAPQDLCKAGSNNSIRIGFACCSEGQATLTIYVNGSTIEYTIPKSDSTWKTYYIPAREGTMVKYAVSPDRKNHYESAKGYFTVYYNNQTY